MVSPIFPLPTSTSGIQLTLCRWVSLRDLASLDSWMDDFINIWCFLITCLCCWNSLKLLMQVSTFSWPSVHWDVKMNGGRYGCLKTTTAWYTLIVSCSSLSAFVTPLGDSGNVFGALEFRHNLEMFEDLIVDAGSLEWLYWSFGDFIVDQSWSRVWLSHDTERQKVWPTFLTWIEPFGWKFFSWLLRLVQPMLWFCTTIVRETSEICGNHTRYRWEGSEM